MFARSLETENFNFHDRGLSHVKTGPLICSANLWIGFYIIETFVMKELSIPYSIFNNLMTTKPTQP